MKSLAVDEACVRLGRLLDEVAASDEPVRITGPRVNGILVSADQWRAIEETLRLLSIPGMRESIVDGMAVPLDECSDEAGW